MRQIVLVTCALVVLNSRAQQYFPFPDSNAVWHVVFTTGDPWNPPVHDYYHYVLTGDTVIGANNYHQLHESSAGYIGAIRTDSLKRTYFFGNPQDVFLSIMDTMGFPVDSTAEYLLYQFGLSVGDTVSLWAAMQSDPPRTVLSVDSTLVAGTYRKLYVVHNPYTDSQGDSWIEGVGSELGLFGPYWSVSFGNGPWLYCFEQDGKYIYPDTTIGGCIAQGIGAPSDVDISIHPNPTSGPLTIRPPNPAYRPGRPQRGSTIAITNSLGQLIMQTTFPESGQLDISAIPSGLYVIILSPPFGGQGAATWRGKVMKR